MEYCCSCLDFLVQDLGPTVSYEFNSTRVRLFVECNDDNDYELCLPGPNRTRPTDVELLPSFPLLTMFNFFFQILMYLSH
jgi:hypothetical protein